MQYSECDRKCRAELRALQAGQCAICGRRVNLVLDHDHDTGEVREFLCARCNNGLGQFQDSDLLLTLASAYLRKHSQRLDVFKLPREKPRKYPIEPTTQPWDNVA